MNRTFFSLAIVLGMSGLLVDSAIKGGAILAVAAVVAMLLRRDSSATRHLVWLVAIVAMLVVPVFSALLPKWQVLPSWAMISHPAPAVEPSAPVQLQPGPLPDPLDADSIGQGSQRLPAQDGLPVAELTFSLPLLTEPPSMLVSQSPPDGTAVQAGSLVANWHWTQSLPLLWVIGFCLLMLRLMAARWMLWNSERRAKLIACWRHSSGGRSSNDSDGSIALVFEAACQKLVVGQHVRLLLHSERTIPLVWGVVRFRLLLPETARQWKEEQLRSVLLHELAHIKRRDTIVQLLTQVACALHWFNPLVWYAAWRLHVERERACDDLVLGSGVRASAYAEHLLDVATRLSSVRWTSACGLAMARKSSLESRLGAVLSAQRNRRRVSTTFGVLALLLGTSITLPIAMLDAGEDAATSPSPAQNEPPADEEPPAEKATPAENDPPAVAATEMKPKHEDAQTLFSKWLPHARSDGKIPGALIGKLGDKVRYFIELNKDEPAGRDLSVKFESLLPRFDAARDWTQEDAVGLLDEVTAIHEIPINNALRETSQQNVLGGQPLPAEFVDAAWGEPAANGLRVAWNLEPRAAEYPLGTSLRSRILIHNSGKESVFFIMPSWQQSGQHRAHKANGEAMKVTSLEWTTLASKLTYRLAPGEYCETPAAGIGIGDGSKVEDWANVRVGSWIEAKQGDEVRFTPAAVEVRYSPSVVGTMVFQGRPLNVDPKDAKDLWKTLITQWIESELPVPDAAADREQIIRRMTLDLFGMPPTPEEIAQFVADKSPKAQDALVDRLLAKPGVVPFTGTLPPGEIRFRVLAADDDAANKPRAVTGPGYYNLSEHHRLQVERATEKNRTVNKATIRFFPSAPNTEPPGKPHEISLPDGRLTFAIAWQPGSDVLWITQKGLVRVYDFTNPAVVKETRLAEPEFVDKVPQPIVEATRAVLKVPGAPVQQQESLMPNDTHAKKLFKIWNSAARENGKIPGALIGLLAESVTVFTNSNPTYRTTPQLLKILPRLDATRDWEGGEVITLLDEIAEVQSSPIEALLEHESNRTFRTGTPLPPELADAPWGERDPSGLRLAWLLEPRSAEQQLGTALKSRILIHNAGKNVVAFRTRTWHQPGQHKASDALGADIFIYTTRWLTRAPLVPFRLAPGEFVEVDAPGIGVGAKDDGGDWKGTRVGSWIHAKDGDELTFIPAAVPLSDWIEEPDVDGQPHWWSDFVIARVNREKPLPHDADTRTQLINRIAMDLLGTPIADEYQADFLADQTPNALQTLAKQITKQPGLTPFTGNLQSGPTTFRIQGADPK